MGVVLQKPLQYLKRAGLAQFFNIVVSYNVNKMLEFISELEAEPIFEGQPEGRERSSSFVNIFDL